ncbi:MAG: HepT-like ribonuclease domain-containing protein [Actinomycetes bacterium]
MTRPDALRIADIVATCQELSPIRSIGYDKFSNDVLIQRAAERLIEIIGEAANRLSEETRNQFPLIPWKRIIRIRTLLAHEYFRVNPEQIWETIEIHVPTLLADLMPKAD